MLPRQRVQRYRRIGDNALAVATRDGVVLVPPFRVLAPLRPAFPGWPHLVLRLQRNALLGQATVIDAGVVPQLGQARIGHLCPALTPAGQQRRRIPVPHLGAKAGLALMAGRASASLDRAHGEHDVRVRLSLAVRALAPMHVQVRHHAATHKLVAHEIPR